MRIISTMVKRSRSARAQSGTGERAAGCKEIETVAALCHSVGLPITLAQLNIKEDIPAKMRLIAEASCAEGETISQHARNAGSVLHAALLVADQYGQRVSFRSGRKKAGWRCANLAYMALVVGRQGVAATRHTRLLLHQTGSNPSLSRACGNKITNELRVHHCWRANFGQRTQDCV